MHLRVVGKLDLTKRIAKAHDPALWKYAATSWHRQYRPYVPFATGTLYNTVTIEAGDCEATIEHTAPYAHYAYFGQVMGPNVPIKQGGAITGWFSPEVPKHYTGAWLHFSGMACARWDQAAAPSRLPVVISEIQQAIENGVFGFND